MRCTRGTVAAALLAAALTLSACTGGSHAPPTTSNATTAPSTTTSVTPPPTAATTTAPKPTPVKTVPVDQIPPGNPKSWVPAGVPTTAKYKEPGDVVPKFTQDMFKNTVDGASAAMTFYFEANNWDVAIGSRPSIITLICPLACSQDVKDSKRRGILKQRLVGGRYRQGEPTIAHPPVSHMATWAGQFNVKISAGRVVDANNVVISRFQAQSFKLELDARLIGKRWRIVSIYLVQ